MSTTTSAQIIAAASDGDLLARAAALGAMLGHTQPVIEHAWRRLVSTEVTIGGETTTLARVHDYAAQVREQALAQVPDLPGRNPAAVTDAMILAALDTLEQQ